MSSSDLTAPRLFSARLPTKAEVRTTRKIDEAGIYDFSKGERGKFFRPDAELRLPIYLNADVRTYLAERAAQQGIPLSQTVNALLKQEIEMIESVK